jgi:hypothetical protein
MASPPLTSPALDARRLRRLTRDFITDADDKRSNPRKALKRVLDRFLRFEWPVYMFGGMVRDIAVTGARAVPRDLDLVVDGADPDALCAHFSDEVRRRTRFGGFNLRICKRGVEWDVDIWPLDETWAFGDSNMEPSIENLPRTTFLNVEAVVVRMAPFPGNVGRTIHESGFFEAINSRTLEVNYRRNRYPSSCVIRSLVTAWRLRYRLGPKLCRYIVEHAPLRDLESLAAFQRAHYGHLRLGKSILRRWIEEVHAHVSSGRTAPLMLSSLVRPKQGHLWEGRQLDFWMQTKPPMDARPDGWTY